MSPSRTSSPLLNTAPQSPRAKLPKTSSRYHRLIQLNEPIGEGDSYYIPPSETGLTTLPNVLSTSMNKDPPQPHEAETLFNALKSEIKWHNLTHATGPLPRLLSAQARPLTLRPDPNPATSPTTVHEPIYRHPTDKYLHPTPFTPLIDTIRIRTEIVARQKLNHALIQLYRDGHDFISEHADKTLDVVPGSKIVNVSFGAERVMRLRMKKARARASANVSANVSMKASTNPNTKHSSSSREGDVPERKSQVIPLQHGSIFLLKPMTNEKWLHSVPTDKRPECEKSEGEKACGGERISITFRCVRTFLSEDMGREVGGEDLERREEGGKDLEWREKGKKDPGKGKGYIWGQGARGKTPETARPVGKGPEGEWKRLINAFGIENQSTEFNWEGTYGDGFDCLDGSLGASVDSVDFGGGNDFAKDDNDHDGRNDENVKEGSCESKE